MLAVAHFKLTESFILKVLFRLREEQKIKIYWRWIKEMKIELMMNVLSLFSLRRIELASCRDDYLTMKWDLFLLFQIFFNYYFVSINLCDGSVLKGFLWNDWFRSYAKWKIWHKFWWTTSEKCFFVLFALTDSIAQQRFLSPRIK